MCLSIKVENPQRVLSEGEHLGFQWATVHNHSGYRCGYVRVPPGHPWHGKDYMDVDASVHGGLTFAEADVDCEAPGEDNAWWLGFDCAHGGDAPDPALPQEPNPFAMMLGRHGVIRTQEYVENECRGLCEQAAEAV